MRSINTSSTPTWFESCEMYVREHPGACIAAAFVAVFLFAGFSSRTPSIVVSDYDEAEMDAAMAAAQANVDEFIDVLTREDGETFTVKAPFPYGDDGNAEVMWVGDVRFENGEFHGVLYNEPEYVSNVRYGQAVSVPKEDVVDWLYVRDGVLEGFFTIGPMTKAMTPAQREQAVRTLSPCEFVRLNLRPLPEVN